MESMGIKKDIVTYNALLDGFMTRRKKIYVGSSSCSVAIYGTYSTVFQVRDLESGKIVALKKVRFDNFEPESVCFMAQEIMILRRLDHPNINKVGGINYFPIIMQHISGVLRT
ncbi:putative serine/threonine-protein kinase [Forsythia ovata]|uniref:Serine/threonine-protein kinase n=1 Tax=Forsythia ovata TaxID=205694 RepID=A0ABD1WIS1_9LAMI